MPSNWCQNFKLKKSSLLFLRFRHFFEQQLPLYFNNSHINKRGQGTSFSILQKLLAALLECSLIRFCSALPKQPEVSESMKLGNYINEFWWLIKVCHYLLKYAMKCCMHVFFINSIYNVIDEYFIHFDDYYRKTDEIGPQSRVNFSRRPNLWVTAVAS